MQLLPAPSDAPQLPVLLKSPLIVMPPPEIMLVKDTVLVPEFFNVTVCGALFVLRSSVGKIRLSGVAVTSGAVAAPVPLKLTVCGAALLVTVTLPVSGPVTVGV